MIKTIVSIENKGEEMSKFVEYEAGFELINSVIGTIVQTEYVEDELSISEEKRSTDKKTLYNLEDEMMQTDYLNFELEKLRVKLDTIEEPYNKILYKRQKLNKNNP